MKQKTTNEQSNVKIRKLKAKNSTYSWFYSSEQQKQSEAPISAQRRKLLFA
jgi:hypothetical protein